MSKVFKSMKYNGISLDPYLVVKKISRPPTADITNETKHIALRGLSMTRRRFGGKVIKVDVFIKSDVLNTVDKLNSIFSEQEKKLEFDDQPDRYYIVSLQSLGEPSSAVRNADITITFLSVDGVAHSASYKKITDYRQDNGKLVFDVINNGNVDAHPIITVKHNAENGYLAFVNKLSVFEVGDREIADAEIREKSVVAYDFKDDKIVNALTTGKKNVAILNDKGQILDKNLQWNTVWNRKHIELEGNISPGYHAGSLTFDIPDGGGLYDYIWWRQVFWCGLMNQYGFIKVMVSDENDQFLYGVETYKRVAGTKTEYNFLVTDGKGGFKTTDLQWSFDATHLDTQNPFNESRGWSDMTRADDTVSVFWWGSQNKRVFPELKGKKSKQVHIAIGTIQGNPLVTHMYIDGFYYRKDKVPYEYNVPNAFGAGTEVVINAENDTVLVDNIPKANIIVDGFFSFPKIPPGTSTLEVYSSSWSTVNPDITLNFEERWL
ncbi:distal tail protein Dit [Streptococcus equi]|uniref:Phage tail protein n=1 Tax=Streptococcus equi subsp. ruminatorum TaxID=254358 RepID=A0A6M1KNP1_9STRE|nr:distal tail protein Dit [Streptococcus equi]NGL84160.1 phage tail protein [Streptococcus equi subsp. ruminatorum]